ncbi:MAG TPA: mechanosensitive ion channel domain-containing protein [Patescibacteria group bacterium]|nr:mechanosensitive ion channel domain-containing protein [Patescibacteria group bacterium]
MIEEFLTTLSSENKLALMWVLGAPVIGLLFFWAAKAHWRTLPNKEALWARWYRRVIPLIGPVINLLVLIVGAALLGKKGLIVDERLSHVVRVLCFAWLGLAAVYSITHSRAKMLLTALVALFFGFLSLTNLLGDVIRLLQDTNFSIGKIELTAYQALKFVFSIVLLMWLANALVRGMEISLKKIRYLRPSTRQLFLSLGRIGVYVIAALVALSTIGIDLTAFAIFGGAVGVGLGFGLQKIASNFISGIILLVERSVEVGDLIEMSTGGVTGIVKKTGARYTLVESYDSREIMIPNEDFITQRVINWTLSDARGLLRLPISVAYGTDLDRAREVMLSAAKSHPRCLADPAPTAMLTEFTDLAINFSLNIWVADIREKRVTTQSEILFSVWRKFLEAGIGMPHQNREWSNKTLEKALAPPEPAPEPEPEKAAG